MKIRPETAHGHGQTTDYAKKAGENSPIIRPELFREGSSCWEDVQEICDPTVKITDEIVANIIIKFFWHSFLQTSVKNDAKSVPLEQISYLFHQIHCFSTRFRSTIKNQQTMVETSTSLLEKLAIDVVRSRGYSLGMLGDILKTIPLFKEVANASLENQKELTQSVDLGSGTGILALAQYVAAQRNELTEHVILAVEKNQTVAQALQRVLNDVSLVLNYDTTSTDMHRFYQDAKVIQVANENIPSHGVPLHIKDQNYTEPFFANLKNLAESGTEEPQSIFPVSIRIKTTAPGIKKPIAVLDPLSLELVRNWDDELNAFVSIEAISIADKLIRQDRIGQELRSKLKVPTLVDWYFRWK